MRNPRVRLLLLASSLSAATAGAQTTVRVCVDSYGDEGNGESSKVSISANGRFVAFQSAAKDLVPGDTNACTDVFLHDRWTGATTMVSVDPYGAPGDSPSFLPTISSDGRHVVFTSCAYNLVASDTNGDWDVFVRDLDTGITTRASVGWNGVETDGPSGWGEGKPVVSADGRYVAFSSRATNLLAQTTLGWQVFLRDVQTATTSLVTVDASGAAGNQTSRSSAISDDGRFVAFDSWASNLVANDRNHAIDVFVHDALTGTTVRGNVDSQGKLSKWSATGSTISADGHTMAFVTHADDLVRDDRNSHVDVFVHDLRTGETTMVSLNSSGKPGNGDAWEQPSLSADGRWVAFTSSASDLVPGDTNKLADVFLRDRQTAQTTRLSLDWQGKQADDNSYYPKLTANGRTVAFYSWSTGLVPDDTNGVHDVFVRGPMLHLEADPVVVTAGGSLTLSAWKGRIASPGLLVVVDLSGQTLFFPVATGPFDGEGNWSFSETVPPALLGHTIGFVVIGFLPVGDLEISNVCTVSVR